MNKEGILARKQYLNEQYDQLKAQMEQLKATANAFYGAIQDCDYWLEQLEKGEKTPPPSQEISNASN